MVHFMIGCVIWDRRLSSFFYSVLRLFLGIDSEGIYRVSGFADDVEALKNSFDKGIFIHTNSGYLG